MLRIALPSGKSLEIGTINLFKESRIPIKRSPGMHEVTFPNSQFLKTGCFLKPKRIPLLVESNHFDVGIVGEDTITESGAKIEICTPLAFNKSTLGTTKCVLFASKNDTVTSVEDMPDNAEILSEYPNITQAFFKKLGKPVRIYESPGSVEAEIPQFYRFGVVLSETGTSLRANKQKVIAELFESRTVLIANKQTLCDSKKNEALETLKCILSGTVIARENIMLVMNVPTNALNDVLGLLQEYSNPTIADLSDKSGYAVQLLLPSADINPLIPQLRKLRVYKIIAMPILSVM